MSAGMNENDTFSPSDVTWVMEPEGLAHLIGAIETAVDVVMDLETTGLNEHAVTNGKTNKGVAARIVLASLTLPQADDAGEPTTWVLPLSHPESPWLGKWRATMTEVAEAISQRKNLINHNVKYDARWVHAHTGIDLSSKILWDTQISSHLLDETRRTRLKERVPETFGVEAWDDFDLSTPGAAETHPLFDFGLYAARDTYWTWKLANNHRRRMYMIDADPNEPPMFEEEVEDARLGRLATYCSMPTTATLTAMEQRGMMLDIAWVEKQVGEHEDAAAELFKDLASIYTSEGMDPENASFAPTSHWFRDWTEIAVEKGDLRVAELTPKGKPKWAKNILVRQSREGSEVAARLLALRDHTKKLEFLRAWLTLVAPDNRIYTNYNAGSVLTGRLSSSGPNMQQVTRALRPAFIPSPGYVIADLDYSQIELRVAAFISRSEPMMQAFRDGRDLHNVLAAAITGKDETDIEADERQFGKAGNFGLIYGMGPYGFREYAEDVYGVSFTLEEASNIYKAFFETWEGIKEWHTKAAARAHNIGQVTSPIGRVRRLPGIWDANEQMVSYSERSAINSPVQGFASDLMQMAAASIEGLLPGHEPVEGARLIGTVHDSILAEVPIERWEEVAKECQARMAGIATDLEKMDCYFDVPLAVEVTVGTRWGLDDIGVIH